MLNTPTPRYITCTSHDTEDGNSKEYSWDPTYISVAKDLLDDKLMLQNVFEGKIVSSQIYPLVFDSKGSHKEMSCRSLEFYREVNQNNDLYKQLSFDEKHFFLIGLRDLFVASCRDMLSDSEKELLKRIADIIDPNEDDPDIVSKEILNMQVTPYPTRSHKMVRFIDCDSTQISSLTEECFIRNELNLLIGFVDPCEMSYHNFENIIDLNSFFDTHFDQFKITKVQQLPDSDVCTFNMICASDILKSLDNQNLYVQPLNKLSRGGQRFIFSSKALSDNLTACLKFYMRNTKIINDKFRFVNWVFRYNKFKPGDKKFICHYDTPYSDPTKKHHSRYTILLYLTPGTADPVLSFDNGKIRIDSIEASGQQIRGVIFDQKYEHEGKAFIDGDKIFIRSELVYEYDAAEYVSDNQVAKRFNQACYMTKQSLFNSEVEKFASDAFNQAAEARVGLSRKFEVNDLFIYKKLGEIPFVTNGYDYWFRKDISVKDAAVLTLCDFFNAKLESGTYFNKIAYQEVINFDVNQIDEIFTYLNSKKMIVEDRNILLKKNENLPSNQDEEDDEECQERINKKVKMSVASDINEQNKAILRHDTNMEIEQNLQEEENKSLEEDNEEEDVEEDENEEEEVEARQGETENCCADHSWGFDATKNRSIRKYLEKCKRAEQYDRWFLKHLCNVYIVDQKIEVQRDNILIDNNTITFKNQIPGFNFASSPMLCSFCHRDVESERYNGYCCETKARCWHESNLTDYVNVEKSHVTEYRCLPSIPYVTSEQGHHLRIDIFHSDLVRSHERTIEHWTLS